MEGNGQVPRTPEELDESVSVTFFVPMFPPSMNALYSIVHAKRQVYLRPEVREFKDKAKLFMPPVKLSPELPASISMTVQGDWFYKNGKMRRLDVQNLEKVVIDFICEKAGVDDCIIWEKFTKKKQAPEREGVSITIKQGHFTVQKGEHNVKGSC